MFNLQTIVFRWTNGVVLDLLTKYGDRLNLTDMMDEFEEQKNMTNFGLDPDNAANYTHKKYSQTVIDDVDDYNRYESYSSRVSLSFFVVFILLVFVYLDYC
jgi:hypothetical protein